MQEVGDQRRASQNQEARGPQHRSTEHSKKQAGRCPKLKFEGNRVRLGAGDGQRQELSRQRGLWVWRQIVETHCAVGAGSSGCG